MDMYLLYRAKKEYDLGKGGTYRCNSCGIEVQDLIRRQKIVSPLNYYFSSTESKQFCTVRYYPISGQQSCTY